MDTVIKVDYCNPVTGFTKLFASIVHSTIWREEMHVKVIWVTMLALADRNGFVATSLPGLADAARVSIEQCQDALKKLGAPDEWSRTKANEGRRIRTLEGGWQILNYLKYRELASQDERRIKVRKAVSEHRQRKQMKSPVIIGNQSKHIAEAEAHAEADAKTKKATAAPKGALVWEPWLEPYRSTFHAIVGRVRSLKALKEAVREPHEELGPEAGLALFERWCKSDKTDFGVGWFASNWRKANTRNGTGASHKTTTQDRNFAVLDQLIAEHNDGKL